MSRRRGSAGSESCSLTPRSSTRSSRRGGGLPDPLVFDAALCLGGSLAATDASLMPTRRWIRNAVLGELPYLGVCLGGQLLAERARGARQAWAAPRRACAASS
jgi:GMP synthase-like glutamine amidotransferase